MPERLSDEAIEREVGALDGWSVEDGKLHKLFEFDDFSEAFAFMAGAALAAEKMDHHPEWSNTWNRVCVDLVTHSANGITSLDVALAKRMNELA